MAQRSLLVPRINSEMLRNRGCDNSIDAGYRDFPVYFTGFYRTLNIILISCIVSQLSVINQGHPL